MKSINMPQFHDTLCSQVAQSTVVESVFAEAAVSTQCIVCSAGTVLSHIGCASDSTVSYSKQFFKLSVALAQSPHGPLLLHWLCIAVLCVLHSAVCMI